MSKIPGMSEEGRREYDRLARQGTNGLGLRPLPDPTQHPGPREEPREWGPLDEIRGT